MIFLYFLLALYPGNGGMCIAHPWKTSRPCPRCYKRCTANVSSPPHYSIVHMIFTFMHLSDAFIQSNMHFLISSCIPWD